MRSFMSRAGKLLLATTMSGAIPTSDTGAKLFTASKGSLPAYSVALAACPPITVTNV
jgi:hypothetical protein